MAQKIFIKPTAQTLPQLKERFPFIFLEKGRLEVDDHSVLWIDSDGSFVRIPIATISTLILGVGTTITHAAIRSCAKANCTICWVGDDSLIFYAYGQTPTATTKNFNIQMKLACDPKNKLIVARNMFMFRFPASEVENKTLKELMGMEGFRVKKSYMDCAEKYDIDWKGRSYIPEKFQLSDITNRILTSANSALYGVISSAIHSLGYSPHIGFVHSGSPLPFVYDIADLYKEYLTIDLAFALTAEMSVDYDKYLLADEFRKRVIEIKLMENIANDLIKILKVK